MEIVLLRHGESQANTGEITPHLTGDFDIPLSLNGHEESRKVGEYLGAPFFRNATVYCSPYRRTRDTLQELLDGARVKVNNVKIYEDPRLREVERGYYDEAKQHPLRLIHGWFYYRHRGGESPADCYDRVSTFLESMMRHVKRNKPERILIVTHGMVIRCFVMRFLHLTIEQFEAMANPKNCDLVKISRVKIQKDCQVSYGNWAVEGLNLR